MGCEGHRGHIHLSWGTGAGQEGACLQFHTIPPSSTFAACQPSSVPWGPPQALIVPLCPSARLS